jgi:hypothetical protein
MRIVDWSLANWVLPGTAGSAKHFLSLYRGLAQVCAKSQARKNVDSTRCRLMRHSDIRTTLNVYGDVVTDEMEQAHSKVVRLAIPRPS